MLKETSKAGRVLILRFLHGYYPREIAQVMQCTREAVEERLRVARSEARQYLENPKSLRFLGHQVSEPRAVATGLSGETHISEKSQAPGDGVAPTGDEV